MKTGCKVWLFLILIMVLVAGCNSVQYPEKTDNIMEKAEPAYSLGVHCDEIISIREIKDLLMTENIEETKNMDISVTKRETANILGNSSECIYRENILNETLFILTISDNELGNNQRAWELSSFRVGKTKLNIGSFSYGEPCRANICYEITFYKEGQPDIEYNIVARSVFYEDWGYQTAEKLATHIAGSSTS